MAHLQRPTNRPVTPQAPFAADLLDRRDFAALLRSAIESAENDSWVLGLEGKWGSGKSYLLDMFEMDLRLTKPDWALVKLDAWKAEARQDPLVSFTVSILQATDRLKDQLNVDEKAGYAASRRKLIDSASDLCQRIAAGTRTAISPVTRNVVSGTVLAVGGDATTAAAAGELAGALASEAVRVKIDEDDPGDEFYRSLAELVRTAKGSAKDRSPRVIVVVDDLDRCRPNYTISLIERMKHYFEVPGLIFILAYDWNVLAQAARAAYSPELDADSYFRRLIDARLPIPDPSAALIETAVFEQLAVSITPSTPGERRSREVFKLLVAQHAASLTMRDWQQVVVRLKFMWASERLQALDASILTCVLVGRFLIRDEFRSPLDESAVKAAMDRGISPLPEDLGDPAIDLFRLIVQKWGEPARAFADAAVGPSSNAEMRLANWVWEKEFKMHYSIGRLITDAARRSGILF